MIALFVSNLHSTSLDAIERWSPDKLLAYFHKACELRKIMGQ
ncbi:hypothetical protein [Agrobacterium rosae]|nr:hypothetical protein [Agrobacterium rosae]